MNTRTNHRFSSEEAAQAFIDKGFAQSEKDTYVSKPMFMDNTEHLKQMGWDIPAEKYWLVVVEAY